MHFIKFCFILVGFGRGQDRGRDSGPSQCAVTGGEARAGRGVQERRARQSRVDVRVVPRLEEARRRVRRHVADGDRADVREVPRGCGLHEVIRAAGPGRSIPAVPDQQLPLLLYAD